MSDDLPDSFDVIVIGTGFPESCLAAAASRINKTVLHIDPNEFYGGSWSSFGLEALCEILDNPNRIDIRNGSHKWHIEDETIENDTESMSMSMETDANKEVIWTKKELLAQTRRFNLDLCPKILYSSGELVKVLVESNICRYAEFRAIDHVCTLYGNNLLNVPCSRSDVFNTEDLTRNEKFLLMKFLRICAVYEEDKSLDDRATYHGRTFAQYLKDQNVTQKILSCVLQAIAMCNEETSFEEGMQRTQHFLTSLGRYGNTPFLFPMYGCGELPQCFCRLCAVFGGIYCLNRSIEEVSFDPINNSAIVITEGQRLHAKHVIIAPGNVPKNLLQNNIGIYGLGHLVNSLSRCIMITSTPFGNAELNSSGGGVNLLRLLAGSREAILIQLSKYSGTCPKDAYIFHITTPAISDSPEADLEPFMMQVFNEKPDSPKILFSAFFTLTSREYVPNAPPINPSIPIVCTPGPTYELDYEETLRHVRNIFTKLYGNAAFLPRAPDPSEIIVDGEDPVAISENNLPDDLRAQLYELEKCTEKMDIMEDNNKR